MISIARIAGILSLPLLAGGLVVMNGTLAAQGTAPKKASAAKLDDYRLKAGRITMRLKVAGAAEAA